MDPLTTGVELERAVDVDEMVGGEELERAVWQGLEAGRSWTLQLLSMGLMALLQRRSSSGCGLPHELQVVETLEKVGLQLPLPARSWREPSK